MVGTGFWFVMPPHNVTWETVPGQDAAQAPDSHFFSHTAPTKRVHTLSSPGVKHLIQWKPAQVYNTAMAKRIVVTGGNSGIGFALCKQLVTEHGCHVYLGSRSLERGTDAVNKIKKVCSKGESSHISTQQPV